MVLGFILYCSLEIQNLKSQRITIRRLDVEAEDKYIWEQEILGVLSFIFASHYICTPEL